MFAILNYTCILSTCKHDTKSKSHVGMKLSPVRVFSCKHPLKCRQEEFMVYVPAVEAFACIFLNDCKIYISLVNYRCGSLTPKVVVREVGFWKSDNDPF